MSKISKKKLSWILVSIYEFVSITLLIVLLIKMNYKGNFYLSGVHPIRYGDVNAEITYIIITLLLPILLNLTYLKLYDSHSHIISLSLLLLTNDISYYHLMRYGCDRTFLGFITLNVIIYISYFIYSYYYVRNKLRDLNEEIQNNKETLAKTSSSITLGQMKPHFMYNTLNTIKYLISEDPRRAEYAIDKFSSYLRTNMNAIDKTNLIPFYEELEHIKNYVDVEKLRFEDRINVEYNIKEQNFFLPPLSVQPLVENAIKHGITKRLKGGTVTITTKKASGNYIIEVKDDGVGFDLETLDEESPSIAIGNIKKRIATISGATFKIDSKENEGTTCIITIPTSIRLEN